MIYSQKDPAYAKKRLPKSWVTIGSHGCFLTSLCNLAGGVKSPDKLLKMEYFTLGGNLYSGKVAEVLGMKMTGRTKMPPKGWCIGVTNKYAPRVPTHFLCVNYHEGIQIDPLDYPAKIEPISYKFYEYRTFDGVKIKDKDPSALRLLMRRAYQNTKAGIVMAKKLNDDEKTVQLKLARRHIDKAMDS